MMEVNPGPATNGMNQNNMYQQQGPGHSTNNSQAVQGAMPMSDDSETPISSPEETYQKISPINQSAPFKREVMDSNSTY